MIEVTIVGMERLQARLEGAPAKLMQALAAATMRLAVEAQRRVMGDKLSGGALKVRTGRLRRSVNVQRIEEPGRIGATTGTNVFYGRIWELYGLPPRTVVPKSKKALYWKGASHPVRRVEIPAQAPRPFLSTVLAEMRDEARTVLAAAAREGVR